MLLSLFKRIVNSISFMTFLIAAGFGILAIVLVCYPKNFFEDQPGLSISDPEVVMFILSLTIGGIFTLTIFSYTMVMSVLNRSISNYSPRLIPLVLHERHHQLILGTTSGTIIYCLVLSLFISGSENREFPSIAAPLAIIFGIICLFLFIYFIHAVSQSIHVNYIIRKSFKNTRNNIFKLLSLKDGLASYGESTSDFPHSLSFDHCGYLNAIRLEKLLSIASEEELEIKLVKPMGSFVLEKEPILTLSRSFDSRLAKRLKRCLAVNRDEPMNVIEVGFKHLVEVAIKASSPAINDPGTALIAIDYLTQLFVIRKRLPEFDHLKSPEGGKVFFSLIDYDTLKKYCFQEIEAFVKEDPLLMEKLKVAKNLV